MYQLFFLSDRMYKLVMSPAENIMGSDEEDGCDGDRSFAVDGMLKKELDGVF